MPSTTHEQFGSLWNKLFPTTLGNGTDYTKVVTPYLYVMPDGFFVLLSANQGERFYKGRMGSVDSSGVNEIQEEMCGTFALSSTALDSLKRKAKVVDVYKKNASNRWCFDRQQEWKLNGIPPFICFAGKLHKDDPRGTKTVDWETLITQEQPLHHRDFVLKRLSATWNESSTNSNFRGFRFDHPDCQFKIWVHEKNRRALKSELNGLKKQIEEFNKILDFCKKFESAAFTFLSTQSFPTTDAGEIDWTALKGWGSLAQEIPFPHLKTRYTNLSKLVNSYEENQTEDERQTLEDAFKEFFKTLPKEANFPTDNVMAEMFQNAFSAFNLAGKDFVRINNYIDCSTLQIWFEMLQRIRHNLGTSEDINELINLCQEYFDIYDRQLPFDPPNDDLLQLGSKLKEKYTWFFQTYGSLMDAKGEFAKDLRDEIESCEKEHAQLQAFQLCKKVERHFSIKDYLKTNDGALKLTKLQSWTKILQIHSSSLDDDCEQLLEKCQNYTTTHACSNMTEAKKTLIDQIVAGYQWFFGTYFPGLEQAVRTNSLNLIANQIKPPRSYVESTVQIAYYSDLEPRHLHAIICRNRGYQLSALQSKISSVVNDFPEDTLLNEFCDRLKWVCSNTIQFMVRKADYFKSPNPRLNALNGNTGEDAFNGNKGKDAFNHLKKVLDVLSNLHTSVLQNKEVKLSYLDSTYLSEEREVVTELYTVTSEFLFLLQVPLSWNLHRQLHEHSDQTEKAEQRLADGRNCRLYKRMSNGGLVLWDIVPNDKTSELEKCNSVHTAIYHQRH